MSNQEDKLKKWEDVGQKFSEAGNQMDKLGTKLIFLLSLPIGGFLLFGFYGLIGGIVLGIIGLAVSK